MTVNNSTFKDFVLACKVANADIFCEKMLTLQQFLREENAKYNLTRLTESPDFEIKHVLDSLAIGKKFLEFATKKLVIADIGCGAGFPTLVLATAYPQLRIFAIESAGKKIGFVKMAAEKLQLNNVVAINGRSIELNRKPEFQGKFDIVTARAVATADKIVRESSKFLRKGGKYLLYQTPIKAQEDLATMQGKSGKWYVTPEFTLPEDGGQRLFLVGEF